MSIGIETRKTDPFFFFMFFSTSSGEVKGFALKVNNFEVKKTNKKISYIKINKKKFLTRNIGCNCYIIVSNHGPESL